MRLIVTRPARDSHHLAKRLAQLGHETLVAPLLEIVPREDVTIPVRPYQAIALTSANALVAPALNPIPPWMRSLPVHAVGRQSAAAAADAGFAGIESRGGDVAGLAAAIMEKRDPAKGPILYLSGAETTGDLKKVLEQARFTVERVILYDAVPAPKFDAEILAALAAGNADGVLLYSPRTARIWMKLIAEAGRSERVRHLVHYCLSQNVADALGGSAIVRVAERPEEADLVALLDRHA